MFALAILIAAGSALAAAQLPPPPPPAIARPQPAQGTRDVVPRPAPKGTGLIRGRVIAADTGTPMRRANVSLSAMPPPQAATPPATVMNNGVPQAIVSVNMARPMTATTDMQGVFEFTGLAPGAYRVFANVGQYSAGYLATAYGAKRVSAMGMPIDSGTPIELADGQRFEKADIALPRGAVITGRVVDDTGEPMSRVQVYTMIVPPGSTRPMRSGGNAATDDLGQFRLFGLAPGDYVVVAEARSQTFVPPNAPPEREEERIGFLTTYFPGTADEGSAQRLRTRLGAETPGAEIRMVSGRMLHVSGTITDSQGRPGARVNGQMMRAASGNFSSFGFNTDEQGRFEMRNIPPGNYRLIVRGRPEGPDSQGNPGELAMVPLAVTADIDGLVVVTGPGASVTGQIVFEQGPPQSAGGQNGPPLRVTAQVADPQSMGPVPSPPPAVVGADYTFTLKGMLGEFLLRASAPGQFLKAVMLGAEDITDTPREFKPGDRVSIVMTSTASTVEGTVTDAKGAPTPDAAIIVFSEDKGAWRFNAIRTRRAGTDPNGHFRLTGLLAGRYFIGAMPRERLNVPSSLQDTAFFEALARDSTTFVIGENEQRQLDLKLAADSGGQ